MDEIAESEYVLGCRKEKQYKVIDVILPKDWEVPAFLFPEDAEIFVNNNKDDEGFVFFSETKTFSDIYYIVIETIRVNKEKEEKVTILNQLQADLQSQFDKLPLKEFKKVRVNISDSKLHNMHGKVDEPIKEEQPSTIKTPIVKDEKIPRP